MESKKTESVKAKGYDEANQVLTDNFGNVYDFKKKTINGVQCKNLILKRKPLQADQNKDKDGKAIIKKHGEFEISVNTKDGVFSFAPDELKSDELKPVKLNVGQHCTAECSECSIEINEDDQLQSISLHSGQKWNIKKDDKELWKCNKTDDNYGELYHRYTNGRCTTLELCNLCRKSATAPEVEEFDGYEILADDNLIKTKFIDDYSAVTHEGSNNVQISKIEPSQTGFKTAQVFQKTFFDKTGAGIKFVDKLGDCIYFFEETESKKKEVAQGNLIVYDTRYNEIVRYAKIDNLKENYNYDDLCNFVAHYNPREFCDINKILKDIGAHVDSPKINTQSKPLFVTTTKTESQNTTEKRNNHPVKFNTTRERSRDKEIDNGKANKNQKNTKKGNDKSPRK